MYKSCSDCGREFIIRGRNHKRCGPCAIVWMKNYQHTWRLNNVVTGEGSGAKPERLNSNYKHGKSVFDRWAREKLKDLGHCERCSKELRHGTGQFVGHHKDHDNLNNVKENLELLCHRCHQIEHECWKNFEGVTTISKESTALIRLEAPSPIYKSMGDDIVCSA